MLIPIADGLYRRVISPAEFTVRPGRGPAGSPCLHLGPETGETVTCGGCAGNPGLKVFACANPIHQRATIAMRVAGLSCCESCPDYQPRPDQPAPGSPAILLTGGIGDTLALDTLMPIELRERLETIYYACPAAREVRMIWQALPGYPRLKHHVVLPTELRVHYTRQAVEADVGALPPAVEDWSIAMVFPQGHKYHGSSALAAPLCAPSSLTPPRPYAIVTHASTWGRWHNRDFNTADWGSCLQTLRRHELLGVVLGNGGPPVPADLLDLRGQTSMLESIELLKGAAGYLGIDSWPSVLAAKLFPASRIAIKSTWSHCYQWRHIYFAPRREVPFLARSLQEWADG